LRAQREEIFLCYLKASKTKQAKQAKQNKAKQAKQAKQAEQAKQAKQAKQACQKYFSVFFPQNSKTKRRSKSEILSCKPL
tara:strand:- start:43 stop:282 length:240 start_codon:yes stop_codon:yes gene_type:complete